MDAQCIDMNGSSQTAKDEGVGSSTTALFVSNTTPNASAGRAVSSDEAVTKWSIWKDVFVVSFGFLFNFIAFNGLTNIQSSLNSDEGLGTASMSVIYALLILSSLLMPQLMIKHLGYKWTMVTCIPFYTLFILINLYPTWYTMIPASMLVGLAAAPLWSAKCSYLTTLSHAYAGISGEPFDAINSRFFGVFFMIFHFDMIIGNLISSLTLNPGGDSHLLQRSYDHCGPVYCNEDLDSFLVSSTNVTHATNASTVLSGANSTRPPRIQIYIMCGIYAGLSLLGAIVIAAFSRPLKSIQVIDRQASGFQLLKMSLQQVTNPLQILMVPLTIFSGLFQTFFSSDFTKAYINCVLGIHFIGFVMMVTGGTDAAFSCIFGVALKYVHRWVVFLIGALLSLGLLVAVAVWHPEPSTSWAFFLISAVFGIADSVWQSHFNAFYGIVFKENLAVAFASYRLWESIGYMTGFIWSTPVCTYVKLYVLIPLVIIGYFCYGGVELKIKTK